MYLQWWKDEVLKERMDAFAPFTVGKINGMEKSKTTGKRVQRHDRRGMIQASVMALIWALMGSTLDALRLMSITPVGPNAL